MAFEDWFFAMIGYGAGVVCLLMFIGVFIELIAVLFFKRD
jgi:hypothetical protein